jgi:hypothetical protein
LAGVSLHIAGQRINAARILLIATAILLSRVGQSNQILGQLGIYFTLFTIIAIRFSRSSTGLSTVGVALASLKPTFGIPLVVLMLAGKKWRPAVFGILLTALGSGLSLSWILVHEPTDLLSSFANSQDAIVSDKDVDPASAWMRTDLLSVVARNFSIATDVQSELLAMFVILLPACIASWYLSSVRDSEETRALEQAVICSAIPLCIYHLSYDLLLLVPALALALGGRIFTTQTHALRYRAAYVALVAIPLMNYFASHSVMAWLNIEGVMREFAISLNAIALLGANCVLWLAVRNHTVKFN